MNQGISVFAETTFRNKYRKFGIKQDDRRRHMYLIGKTGMGKSTILENMIVGDIRAGHGVAVIDPHGDLAEKVIKYIPSSRINDIIYFNPADYEYPIAFNVVEQVESHLRHLVASGLIGVFQKLWADSWGPRLEYILRNTILAILDYPGSTLLAVTRMLSDKKFRKKIIEKIEDPVVRAFWVNEFAGYADKFASEAVSPIQNKVGQFLSTSLIRNIVGQVKSTINMREVMDSGKILIVNLSKGRIGEDSSALLGAMIITKIQLAAMSRVDIPEDDRRDFYLYIDEFQNFTTDSFSNILSEARKYKLNLILAHQYIEQLGEVVRYAVFGNVGTLVVFRVGAADAEALEPEFTPTFLAEDILNLPKYEFYLKLMIDGIASEPFSARGLAPLRKDEETHNLEKIIAVSRERYAKDKATVEEKIARWHSDETPATNPTSNNMVNTQTPTINNSAPKTPETKSYQPNTQKPTVGSNRESKPLPVTSKPISPKPRAEQPITSSVASVTPNNNPDSSTVIKFSVNCSRCGVETKLPFKPDGIRPVFCKDCLAASREEKKKEVETRRKLKEEELKNIQQKNETVNLKPAPTPIAPMPLPKIPTTIEKKMPELSLSDALKMNPVNFKGREIVKNDIPSSIDTKADQKVPTTPSNEIKNNVITPPVPEKSTSLIKEEEIEIEIDKTINF